MSMQQKVSSTWKTWVPPLVGLLVGLMIGLLIGWVWWPVDWTNAQVADLSREQQAIYLASAAEAYVQSGLPDRTQTLQARLAPLGDEADEAIIAAIDYFRTLPVVNELAVSDLAIAATELGIPLDAAMLQPQPNVAGEPAEAVDPVESAVVEPAAEAVATTESATEEGGSGFLTWFLALVAAAALIGGGIYLLRRMRKSGEVSDNMTSPTPDAYATDPLSPVPVAATQPTSSSRTVAWSNARPQQSLEVNELAFADEEDEEPAVRFGTPVEEELPFQPAGDDGTSALDEEDEDDPPQQRYGIPASPASFEQTVEQIESPAESVGVAAVALPSGGDVAETVTDTVVETVPLAAAAAAIAIATPEPAAGPVLMASVAAEPIVGPSTPSPSKRASSRAGAEVATYGVQVPARTPVQPSRKVVATYATHFQAGMPDYIEAHNITDPASGKYIGECGMGVSSKNRVLHDNPDQVIALEVWMYDKLDPKDNINNARVLLSEYAAAHDYAQAWADEPNGTLKTIVAEPGTRFQLEGRNLILDGEIIEASYDTDGIYRNVKVIMNILSKK
jgi:hypothetical protein